MQFFFLALMNFTSVLFANANDDDDDDVIAQDNRTKAQSIQ